MRSRSLGAKTLAVGTAAVAFYSQLAGLGLLLTGSVFGVYGSFETMATLVVGGLFLAVSLAAYALAYAFWVGKPWSRALGTPVYATLIGASVMLAILSTSVVSAVLPSIAAIAVIWYLHRPATRAEFERAPAPAQATVAVTEKLKVAKSAH